MVGWFCCYFLRDLSMGYRVIGLLRVTPAAEVGGGGGGGGEKIYITKNDNYNGNYDLGPVKTFNGLKARTKQYNRKLQLQ